MNRAARRAAAATERHEHVPSDHARVCIQAAAHAADRVWDCDGQAPIMVLAIEGPGSGILVRVGPLAAELADLERVAPELATYARRLERMRRLASADGVLIAVPADGAIAGGVYGRRGRFLAEENLGDLEALSRDEMPISIGGEA